MTNVHQFEVKQLEQRYGPAIAQHIMDELEVTHRLEEKAKERQLINGYGERTIYVRAA